MPRSAYPLLDFLEDFRESARRVQGPPFGCIACPTCGQYHSETDVPAHVCAITVPTEDAA